MNYNRLIKLAEQDLSNAMDNLARANLAARASDPTKQWGQSGRTLQEIIDGYKRWANEATETLTDLKRVQQEQS